VPQKEHRDDRKGQGRDLKCFVCNQIGHFARNCPGRVSRVNSIFQGKQNFVLDAQINGLPTKALIDSGVQVTVVPAGVIPPSAYTTSTWV